MRLLAQRRRRWNELLTHVRQELVRNEYRSEQRAFADWSFTVDVSNFEHAVTLALPWLAAWEACDKQHVARYLVENSPPGVAAVVRVASNLAGTVTGPLDDLRHAFGYEELLAATDSKERRRKGVYYTPIEIARYIVAQVDHTLQRDLGFAEGLADSSFDHNDLPAIRILDPAAGSGVFLAEVIRSIHRRLFTSTNYEIAERWNAYVSKNLLPRLTGWEIMPAAVVAGHCVLANALDATGYRFAADQPIQLLLRDALAPPGTESVANVIIGNPPYASLSTAQHGWIESLIDTYRFVDGLRLGEKKHWLHDEYVKFLRLAQWHIEQSSQGVVGLVTNHGYLENASFRGLRRSLLDTFQRISLVDLHGNAKMGERSPDGNRDENVFGIASGVAIGVFTRGTIIPSDTKRADLWGSRSEKLAQLETDNVDTTPLHPTPPHYRFSAATRAACPHYQQSWRLCDAMPLSTTAPVTARDGFVVAFTREELLQRGNDFCDLSISDDVIRARWFNKTRSSKYPAGDSRGWQLGAARHRLADDPHWPGRIVLCQYRPLDYRYVLWHEALIDWPRTETMRHLLNFPNLALIARRQSPRGLPANFFWATQALALDGIVRSDNRGSESLFPLWRFNAAGQPEANFAPDFICAVEQATVLPFVEQYSLDLRASRCQLTPLSLAGYLYGLFWSPEYRTVHQFEIADDFPRILLPRDADEFHGVSQRGLRLLECHTALPKSAETSNESPEFVIAAGFPKWLQGNVWINATTSIAPLSESAWNLRIGAHQPAKKWLQQRRNREITCSEVAQYRELLRRLERTVEEVVAAGT